MFTKPNQECCKLECLEWAGQVKSMDVTLQDVDFLQRVARLEDCTKKWKYMHTSFIFECHANMTPPILPDVIRQKIGCPLIPMAAKNDTADTQYVRASLSALVSLSLNFLYLTSMQGSNKSSERITETLETFDVRASAGLDNNGGAMANEGCNNPKEDWWDFWCLGCRCRTSPYASAPTPSESLSFTSRGFEIGVTKIASHLPVWGSEMARSRTICTILHGSIDTIELRNAPAWFDAARAWPRTMVSSDVTAMTEMATWAQLHIVK